MSTGSALVLKTDERVRGIGGSGFRTFVLGFLTISHPLTASVGV